MSKESCEKDWNSIEIIYELDHTYNMYKLYVLWKTHFKKWNADCVGMRIHDTTQSARQRRIINRSHDFLQRKHS